MASDASALVSEKRARSEGELVQRPRPKKKGVENVENQNLQNHLMLNLAMIRRSPCFVIINTKTSKTPVSAHWPDSFREPHPRVSNRPNCRV